MELEQGALLARCRTLGSTESVQEEEAAEKDGQRNPEMKVGHDGVEHVARTIGFAGRHCSLGIECPESGVPS
jgi:hypothetical protein